MTFFIPPVFLFGNNANRVPYDEEKKSEYKTAAETEIKVENWRAKRIAELEEENKKLKERVSELEDVSEDYDLLSKDFITLWEENEELKEKLKKTNELLSSAARCAEQYRGKMISVMEELKMFLYKD